MENALRIHISDTVAVALRPLKSGEEALGITLVTDVPKGHKFALVAMKKDQDIIKYAYPIGHALCDIAPGEHVHTHNLKTNLSGTLEYTYQPELPQFAAQTPLTFQGYVREDGRVGIRNEIWIINTVGCVNRTAERIARLAGERHAHQVDGVHAFSHPFGCSQLGDDHQNTQKILAALARHPNAGGVLVLGLGCENNHIAAFRKVLGEVNPQRVKFLSTQEVDDEVEEGLKLIAELAEYAAAQKRQTVGADKLIVGLKCGGSDGFSGITANPLLGAFSDRLIAQGGTTLLTEVPEMFGAETILMRRCENQAVFERAVGMINGFKQYFKRYDQPVYENPSPGNKEGGISTLEDKSLGCTQKGGTARVSDVMDYAQPAVTPGLNLVYGPGNDAVSVTALSAAGAQLVLFTTGRGNPLGGPVPTIKVSSNSELAARKPQWIDFDAGVLLTGTGMDEAADAFMARVLSIASGEALANNEKYGYREISIFKDGVTL